MYLHLLPTNEIQFLFPNFTRAEIGTRTVSSTAFGNQVLINGRTVFNLTNGVVVCSPFVG